MLDDLIVKVAGHTINISSAWNGRVLRFAVILEQACYLRTALQEANLEMDIAIVVPLIWREERSPRSVLGFNVQFDGTMVTSAPYLKVEPYEGQ